MKRLLRLKALILAVCSLFAFAACNGETADEKEDTSIEMEDGEDVGVERGKITVINVTGKDAVSLIARKPGGTEWSANILSQDYLHNNMAVEVTYGVNDNNIYDLRLVFEDGSYKELTNVDFTSGQVMFSSDGEETTAE